MYKEFVLLTLFSIAIMTLVWAMVVRRVPDPRHRAYLMGCGATQIASMILIGAVFIYITSGPPHPGRADETLARLHATTIGFRIVFVPLAFLILGLILREVLRRPSFGSLVMFAGFLVLALRPLSHWAFSLPANYEKLLSSAYLGSGAMGIALAGSFLHSAKKRSQTGSELQRTRLLAAAAVTTFPLIPFAVDAMESLF